VGATAVKDRIGRFGCFMVWPASVPVDELRAAAQEIEQLGYGTLWVPEAPMLRESLVQAALLLQSTERLTIATGITSIYTRDPTAAEMGSAALAEAYPGRFILGLGCSHVSSVEYRGHEYGPPVATTRRYLEAMNAAQLDGLVKAPRLLAALRPRMLKLAAERTIGAHTFFVPALHSARAREILGEELLLAPAHAVVLESDPERARARGREYAAGYLQLPNYVENLRTLGYGDDDLEHDRPSDHLLDAVVAWGSEERVAESLRAHHQSGADHIAVMPAGVDHRAALEVLRRLAPVLLEGHR
jgi:probable F420-dependent oxidoreductase